MELDAPAPAETAAPLHPIRAIIGLGTIQALTMAAGLARTKVLASLLGPAGTGVASVIDQVVSLAAQVGSISLPFAALKFLSRLNRGDDARERQQAFAALATLMLVASSVAAAIVFVVAAWRPRVFGDGLVPYRTALLLAITGVIPFAIVPMLRNTLAALARERAAATATFLSAVLTVAASYIGVTLGGLNGLYVANAVVSTLTVLALQRYVSRAMVLPFVLLMRIRQAIATLTSQPGLVRFCTALYVLAFTSPIAYLYSRSTLLSTHGAIEAGWAAAAYGIAVSVRLVLHQANALYLMPLVNRDGSKSHRTAIVNDYLRILVLVVVLSILAVVLFPRLVLRILYSSSFLGATSSVTVFVIAEVVLLFAGVYQSLLVGFDDTIGLLASTAGGQLVTIALSNVLVPTLGAPGMGIAFLTGNAVILVACAARLRFNHGAVSLFKPIAPLTIALALIGAIGWWAAHAGDPSVALRLAIYVVAVAVVFALLRPAERQWLVQIWWVRSGRSSG